MKKAGLVYSPKRNVYIITDEGKKVLESKIIISNDVLMQYESFRNFVNRNTERNDVIIKVEAPNTPIEDIENAVKTLNTNLADDILTEIMNQTPDFFESLVVKLLLKMGYGRDKDSGIVTSKTADGGIDGIISEDLLGFDKIYIQAKRWKLENTVGRPEIQKFVGALAGQSSTKELFITTAKFTKQAIEYVENNNALKVILVGGDKLANFMIEFELGVSKSAEYTIKQIDSDFFEGE